MLEESRQIAERFGDAGALAYAIQFSGFAALYQGDTVRAVTLAREGLRLHRIAANAPGAAGALLHLGMTYSFQGDLGRALQCFDESLAISQAEGDRWIRSNTLFGLGLVLWRRDNTRGAIDREKESLRLKVALDDRSGIALCLEALSWVAATDSQAERAATLLGAARSIWDSLTTSTYGPWRAYHDECEARARNELGIRSVRGGLSQGPGDAGRAGGRVRA